MTTKYKIVDEANHQIYTETLTKSVAEEIAEEMNECTGAHCTVEEIED